MKILGRVAFALVVAILYLWVLDYTNGLMTTLYFDKYGTQALIETTPDYFFFYSSIPDYHKSEPIYRYDDQNYAIRFYEVATVDETELGLEVGEYAYILIHDKTGTMAGNYTMVLTDDSQTDVASIEIVQFRSLDLYVGINAEFSVYINKSTLTTLPFARLSLLSSTEEVLLETTGSVESADFTIKQQLTDFFTENSTLPQLELQEAGVFRNNPHVMTEFEYIFWVGTGGYLSIVLLITYFLYFFRKRYLGKNTPTPLLKQDIERDHK